MAETKKKKFTGIKLMKVRASFPHLEKPRENDKGGKAKYELTILIPKSRDITDIKKQVTAAKVAKWGKDKESWPKLKYPTCIMDGDEKDDIEGYAGHYYIKCTSVRRPAIVDMNNEAIPADTIRGGNFVNVGINIGAYEFKDGKLTSRGVSAYVEAVQFDEDKPGKPFGNASNPEDIFGAGSGDDEDEESEEDEDLDEEDEPAPKKKKAKAPVDEDEDEDFDDEDEEPAPKKKGKAKRPTLDEDEDEE